MNKKEIGFKLAKKIAYITKLIEQNKQETETQKTFVNHQKSKISGIKVAADELNIDSEKYINPIMRYLITLNLEEIDQFTYNDLLILEKQ